MQGISLSWRDLPIELVKQHRPPCVKRDDGEREYRFMYRDKKPRLPVWIGNQLRIATWSGYCRQESLAAGDWSHRNPEPVEIPATFGFNNGVWFTVDEGVRGVLAHGRVYVLTMESSHYYKIMTRSERMMVFVGRQI